MHSSSDVSTKTSTNGPNCSTCRGPSARVSRVRRDRGGDHGAAVAREPRGDPADPLDVRVAVLLREAEALREVRADRVAVEVLDDEAARVELRPDDVRDRRLARAREPGEPEREAAAADAVRLGMLVREDVVGHGSPCSLCVDVDAALELVGAGPAACALLLLGRRRPGAGDAPDRPVARLVQRVERNLVDVRCRPRRASRPSRRAGAPSRRS